MQTLQAADNFAGGFFIAQRIEEVVIAVKQTRRPDKLEKGV